MNTGAAQDSETATNNPWTSRGGFYFIATALDMRVRLPVDVTPTLRLDKASDAQLEVIYQFLEEGHTLGLRMTNRHYYEAERVKDKPTDSHYKFVTQPKEHWRYYVINFVGSNYEGHQFFSIADLVFPYLASFATGLTADEFGSGQPRGRMYDPLGSQTFYSVIMGNDSSPRTFDEQCLHRLQELLGRFHALDKNKHEGILRAIDYHKNIQRLASLNNLHVLGLFMIVEMLLTHNPNDKEIGDSLSHQIKTKIALLSPRFTAPLDYSVFDNQTSPEKIWGSLYAYRSCIAHGNHIDFTKGALKVLKDSRTADAFLILATKTLLAHALIEPDLINGLKPI